MRIKPKLRRIGNSFGVIIPKEVITGVKLGEEVELDVITPSFTSYNSTAVAKQSQVITFPKKHFNSNWCSKHDAYKGSCGCK